MKLLVVGSGGREHAIVWKLARSKAAKKIFCSPGNGGIMGEAELVAIRPDDITSLVDFAINKDIDLTVVGPEVPLVRGIVDEFEDKGLNIFGPSGSLAMLEGSKIFAKETMKRFNIPTADFRVFSRPQEAKDYIKKRGAPIVIKADGLAAGKGVIVAKTVEEAFEAVDIMLVKKAFGAAGDRIIIEDCLEGEEASILVVTDSKTIIPLVSSQDHKRVFDGDRGPNTGGMGAYSPAPVVTDRMFSEIMDTIFRPLINGLAREGMLYKGILYGGLMITSNGPKVLEFNVRFGDPETQAILPRLKTDLLEVALACINGKLDTISLEWDERACVSVVLASGGYPGSYERHKEIKGLENLKGKEDVMVFHAGTEFKDGKYYTNGGRVLAVSALGTDIVSAQKKAYGSIGEISFEGMHYRKDIARKALLKREEEVLE